MLKKNLLLIILFLISIQIFSQKNVFKNIQYSSSEIEKSTFQYAKVDWNNIFALWLEEWDIAPFPLPPTLHKPFLGKFDIYGPKDTIVRPVLIFLHGGAFVPIKGAKDDEYIKELSFEFAQRGYRVISVEYRDMNVFAPSYLKGGYMATQDTKAAIRYIANHASELKVNPNKMFLSGISAGAITALNAAFLDQGEPILGRGKKFDRMFGCLDCVGENKINDFKIRGVINIAGGVYDLSILNNNNIACLSFHGLKDNVIPIEKGIPFNKFTNLYNTYALQPFRILATWLNSPRLQKEVNEAKVSSIFGSKELHKYLISINKTSEFVEFPDGTHYLAFSQNSVFMQSGVEIIDKMSEFMYGKL